MLKAFCCPALCLLLAACSSGGGNQAALNPAAHGELPFPAERAVSEPTADFLNGADADSQSFGAVEEFEVHMVLDATAGGLQFAQYRFDTEAEPEEVLVMLRDESTTGAWVGLANYSSGRWEFSGPYEQSALLDIDPVQHVSPLGNTWVAVSVGPGAEARVEALQMNPAGPAEGWTVVPVDQPGSTGYYPSIALVDGNPAIAYQNIDSDTLLYTRAASTRGDAPTDWGSPVAVHDGGKATWEKTLLVVNGNPAIGFSWGGIFDNVLCYVRASSPQGMGQSDWPEPIVVDSVLKRGGGASMAIVSGNPAMSYEDAELGEIIYVRSSSADGMQGGWSVPLSVSDRGGPDTSLAVVAGNPAIAYRDSSENYLRYVASTGPTGADGEWTIGWAIDTSGGNAPKLRVVEGNPAVGYMHIGQDTINYARSTTNNGSEHSEWPGTVVTEFEDYVPIYGSTGFEIVGGKPALAYEDYVNRDLCYVEALESNPQSAEDWGEPVTVDSLTQTGWMVSMAVVDGSPALAYFDATNADLMYAIRDAQQ